MRPEAAASEVLEPAHRVGVALGHDQIHVAIAVEIGRTEGGGVPDVVGHHLLRPEAAPQVLVPGDPVRDRAVRDVQPRPHRALFIQKIHDQSLS